MPILVLLTFAAIGVGNYCISRDFRYPPVLMSVVWLAALSLYYLSPIEINKIGILTSLVFIMAVLSFSAGGLIAFDLSRAVEKPRFFQDTNRAFPIRRSVLRGIFLALSLAALPLMFQRAIELAAQSGSEIFLVGLRLEMQATDTGGYGRLGYAAILSWFTTFVYAIEPRTSRWERIQYYLSMVVSLTYATMTTGRTSFVLLLVGISGVHLIQSKFRLRTLIFSSIGFLLSFALLGIALLKIDGSDESWANTFAAIGESVVVYAEGSIPAFDQVIQRNAPLEYGRNTFVGPLNTLRRLRGDTAVSPIQDEVYVPFPVNVYTALHPVYLDFGPVGVMVAFLILGATSTFIYLRALTGDGLYVLYFSLGLFPLFLTAFTDQYFAPMTGWAVYALLGYLYFRVIRRRGPDSNRREVSFPIVSLES